MNFFRKKGTVTSIWNDVTDKELVIAGVFEREFAARGITQFETPKDQRKARATLLEVLQEKVVAEPEEVVWHAMLGLHYLENGPVAKARPELETALNLDPNDPRILYRLGLFHYGAFQDALDIESGSEGFEIGLAMASNQTREGVKKSKAIFKGAGAELEADEYGEKALAFFQSAVEFRLPGNERRQIEEHIATVKTLLSLRESSDDRVEAMKRAIKSDQGL